MLAAIFLLLDDGFKKIDYDQIVEKGDKKMAIISGLETQYNTTVNGVHPTIISFYYEKNDVIINSDYQVLETQKIESLIVGSEITIIELEGQSVIEGIRPYSFPFVLLFIIPIPFLMIGLPVLVFSLYHYLRIAKLYKRGEVIRAKILSLSSIDGLPILNIGRGVLVHYEYNKDGNVIISEENSTDLDFFTEKKEGEIISVFVNRKRINKSCIVPRLESIRNGWNILL